MILLNDGTLCDICLNKVYKRLNRWRYLKRRKVKATHDILLPEATQRCKLCTKCARGSKRRDW